MVLFINSKFCKLLLPNKKSLVWVLSLIFALSSGLQSFAQLARRNTFYGYPDATKLYSKKSAFLWVYPSVSGSPINDISYNFAVGESGLHLKFGSITYPNGVYYDFDVDLDDRNIPTSLDYKNILFSNANSFISTTFNNEIAYLFNSYRVDSPILFWRKQLPSNLIPYEVIGFQSVGKGYIVKNNSLYTTSDSATTWQEVRVLPFQNVRLLNSFSSNQILIVHHQDSLKISLNNGLNFINTTGISGTIKHLESTNGRLIFATTSDGFYTSNDSGRVWQIMPNIPVGKASYLCPINNRNWFLAIDNRLYKT
ncbi:MAG: WD40/YVTN/BNR-like repeat-containing protein, partial [Flexibacteraceae bacterium]